VHKQLVKSIIAHKDATDAASASRLELSFLEELQRETLMGGYQRVVRMGAAGLALGAGFVAGTAFGAGNEDAALRMRLDRLESEVEVLRAGDEGRRWLTEQRAEEVRALARDVLADADARASFQEDSVCAGHDRRFFIRSADGGFRLSLLGQVQTRFVVSRQDDAADGDSTRWGFEDSRVRFGFLGHIIDPSWQYVVWAGWTAGGRSVLIDASITKDLGGGWKFQVGQFKLPVWKEWLIFEGFQQFADRSLLTARYGGLAAQGVALIRETDAWRLKAAFTDGGRTWFTAWSVGPDATSGALPWQLSNEWAVTVRGELLLEGEWASCPAWESWIGEAPQLRLGAAVHAQRGEFGTSDDENEILQWTIDAGAEFGGANLFAALIATHFENSAEERDEWGVLLQGGYFLNKDWEAIARLEYGDLDGGGSVSDELLIVTVGLNRFWARHALKWTTDLGYAFEPVDAAWGGAGVGWRADEAGGDGQIVLRTQLQILF
jgi:hypothetical protein